MRRLLLFPLLIVIFLGCQKPKTAKEQLKQILSEYAIEMKDKYGLFLIDQSPLEKKKISLTFYHYHPSEVHTARHLIHTTTEKLLKRINQNCQVKEHLNHFPITERDLDMAISFIDLKTLKRHEYSQVAHAVLLEGIIYYSAYEKELEEVSPIHEELYISHLRK